MAGIVYSPFKLDFRRKFPLYGIVQQPKIRLNSCKGTSYKINVAMENRLSRNIRLGIVNVGFQKIRSEKGSFLLDIS